MSRSSTTNCLIGLVALMTVACSQPRKAGDRACRKADRHLARAVWLCPDILTRDSATVTFTLPGDSVATTLRYTDPLVDSLLAACEQFAAVLLAERRLLGDIDTTVHRSPIVVHPARAPAVAAIQRVACAFEPYTETVGLCTITVRPGANGPLLTVVQEPYTQTQRTPCPPQVQRPPCPPPGVAGWYRWGFWICAPLCLLLLVLFMRRFLLAFNRSFSANNPQEQG